MSKFEKFIKAIDQKEDWIEELCSCYFETENNNKEYIKNIKNCGCAICDEKDIACLDFHHLRDKEFNIANEIKNLSIDNLKKEIDKCIVLCANCHRKLHYYNLSIEELKRLHSVPEVA